MARWLIQCGGSDVTGKMKMGIISREEDRDVEWIQRGIRRWVFTVSECHRLPLELALGRIYPFGWQLYSTTCPKRGEKSTVLLCFETGTTPSTNMFKWFFCIYLEWDFGCLCLHWMVLTGLPHCEPGRDQGRQGRRAVLWIRSSAEKRVMEGFVNPCY